jgi:CHRD domain
MKTISNYRKTFFPLLATSLVTCSLLVACDKDDDDIDNNDMFALSGSASGSKEIPTNTTTGTATITGTYNRATNSLSYTINWTGLTGNLTAAHFHGPATATESANPMLDITIGTNGMNGSTSATVTVTDAFETALLDGKIYYNLHTALYPNGEVRSQVTASPQ